MILIIYIKRVLFNFLTWGIKVLYLCARSLFDMDRFNMALFYLVADLMASAAVDYDGDFTSF